MSRTTFRSEVLGEEAAEKLPRPLLSRERRPAASRPVGEGSAIQDESVTSLPLFLVSFRRCVRRGRIPDPDARNGRQFSESGEKWPSDAEFFAKTFHVKRSKVQENKTRIVLDAVIRTRVVSPRPQRDRGRKESGVLSLRLCSGLRLVEAEASGCALNDTRARDCHWALAFWTVESVGVSHYTSTGTDAEIGGRKNHV